MKLPQIAIKNHQFTLVIIVLIVLNGLVAFLTMPKYEDPLSSYPFTSVVVIHPGATPENMENLVIDPIEEVINELEDIKNITSTAFDGGAMVGIEYEDGIDIEEKYRAVVEKVNSIRNELPEDLYSLEINKPSVLDVSIFQIAVYSDFSDYEALENVAERLKKRLEKIYGVREVDIDAIPEKQVSISLDFERLAQLNIPVNQIIGIVGGEGASIPGGDLDIGTKRFNIITSGDFETLDEIRNTVIYAANESVIRLSDVARVNYDYEKNKYYARLNGIPAVWVSVKQKGGINIYGIADEINQDLELFRKVLPADVSLEVVMDQSESVRYRIDDFFSNFLQGILLVGILILIVIGFRASMVVMMAIPISVLIGLTLLDLSGFGLQQMSVAGLIIALGLLVDNSIAVVENIVRFLEMGYSKKEAAIKGTGEIGWALISSTLTTVLAFFPMIILPGPTGDFIRSLAVVVVYTLMASLIIALTFTPYMGSVILKLKTKKKKENWIERIINHRYPVLLQAILDWPKTSIGLTSVIFISSISLVGIVGVSFFPKAEKAQLLIDVNTPEGSNLARTNEAVKFVESELEKIDQVEKIASNIGHGNPQVYYNRMPRNYATNHGQLFISLKSYDNYKMNELVRNLRKTFGVYPGAKIEVKEFIQGPPIEAPIAVKIIGNDMDKLKRVSGDVENILQSYIGVINVNNPISEKRINLEVDINRQKASIMGVLINDVDQAVRINMAGIEVGKYQDNEGEYYDIILRNPGHQALDMNDFEKIFVPSQTGEQIKLSHVADLKLTESMIQIDHYNLDRVVSVTADVETDNVSVFDITDRIDEYLASYEFPEDVTYKIGGEQESRSDSFGNMGQALIVALIGIFAILVLQFKSFTQPLIIYAAIPLSVTGSFIALFITGHSFSFMAFVGLTSLVGIVVNDSIVLVDYANQVRAAGKNIVGAVVEAGKTRFMPILLTTLTTVAGLLPLTLRGGDMWAPMGWAIIGGLILSTFLSLLIVPLLYKIFSTQDAG